MKKSIFLIVVVLISITIACSSNDDSNNSSTAFDIDEMLANMVSLKITPSINEFVSEANNLEQSIINYVNNPTESGLTQIRQQWKTTAVAYESTYVYHIGLARDLFLHTTIYDWPTVSGAIEFFISDNDTINENFMNTISAQAKSLAALEYLLFSENLSLTNSAFINSQNRKDYLRLSASYVTTRANLLLDVWNPSGQNYAGTFISNEGSGIDESINLYYNGIHNALDVTKTTKVGKPAGLENSQVINPELTQAYYSDTSLDLIRASVESTQESFFGPGLSINDYIASIAGNNELNDAIQNKISEIYVVIDSINIPLDQAVTQNNVLVEDLHSKLEELRILVAVDVQSILSIVITTTDTDGD